MSSEENIVFNLDLNVTSAETKSRKIEMIIYRVLGLWGRVCRVFGVPEDSPAVQIVQKAQQATMILRQVHTAAVLAESAAGPVGWAMAGIGIVGAGLTITEFMTSAGE
jgi:hypothetical protein